MKFLSVVFSLALAGAAQAQTFECEMTNKGSGGWIGNKMLFSIEPEEGVGAVLDWAIQEVHKAPIPVRVVKRSSTSWKFFWNVKGVKSANIGKAALNYNATLDTKRMRVRVNGALAGYDNNISGNGPCKIVGR